MSDSEPLRRVLTICNARGLHARSSAKFVKCVAAQDAQVLVRRDGMEVGGTSIMGLLMLGAAQGCEIEVLTTGPAAQAALDALTALVDSGFGEET